ncbi:MAG: D-glycero-beta-D-manno-heptose-7-phosphate kinase [Pyrinomonadaceae bacterium]
MYNLDNFSKVRVLVIGDVMIDKYLWGDVTRISPEAPVPVVRLKETSFIAGGAANVAANVAGLGATARLIGVVGDDVEGEIFTGILEKSGVSARHVVKSATRQTTVKTRIIAHNQQIARLDQETVEELNGQEEHFVRENFRAAAAEADILVVSDYGKGVLNQSLLASLITYAKEKGKTILIDPKGLDYSKYRGATIITPNKFEMAEVCGCGTTNTAEISRSGRKMLEDLELKAVIVTRGEEGITLIEKGRKPLTLKAVSRKVYDVTGAGDTFISALAVAVGAGENFRAASEIANAAAGLAVEDVGTTVIRINKLSRRLER